MNNVRKLISVIYISVKIIVFIDLYLLTSLIINAVYVFMRQVILTDKELEQWEQSYK